MTPKKKHQPILKYPGISRILICDLGTGRYEEPKRGKKFRVSKGANDKRGRKCFETFAEAKEFWISTTSPQIASPSGSMQFLDVVERWKTDWLPSKDRSTQIRYKSYLQHFDFFNPLPMESIGPNTIDKWITLIKTPEYLAKGNSTRCNYRHEFSILKLIMNFYSSRFNRNFRSPFISDHRKMLKVKEKAVVFKDLKVEEFKKFIQALKQVCAKADQLPIYYLALMQYATYSRVQEAAALSYEDFNFEQGRVLVRKKVQWIRAKGEADCISDGSKINGGKEIPMSELAAKVFKEWTLVSGIRSNLLFQLDGKILTYRQIEYRYSQALKLAGLPFRATHILRHASLTEFYDTCKDLMQTAKVAGHASTRTTERYSKVRSESIAATQKDVDKRQTGILDSEKSTGTNGHHLRVIK